MEIYQNNKHLTVNYEENKNYIIFNWKSMAMPFEEIKDVMLNTLPLIRKEEIKTLIADTSNATSVLFPEAIEWWGNEMVPKLARAGVNQIITVKGGSALARITNQRWHNATDGLDLYEVSSFSDIKTILKEID